MGLGKSLYLVKYLLCIVGLLLLQKTQAVWSGISSLFSSSPTSLISVVLSPPAHIYINLWEQGM